MDEYNELEIQELEISKGEHLSDVFKKKGYECNGIPTNCIFDKTLPGLGATYSEIKAERNSIIIEPNVPVIIGKIKVNKNILGVYEKCTDEAIIKYLSNNRIKFKKVICTPEGYIRVKDIAKNIVDLYNNYFMLFDECEKLTQDIDYREAISLPMNDFFQFKGKAFVSATPVYLRNPEFKKNGFILLKVKPIYPYKQAIDLITTMNYEETVISELKKSKDSKCICIFMNSTNGISKLIDNLKKQGIDDYKAFCSKKSVINLKDSGIINSFENLDLPLAKYNFFTSRFFSAVDIICDKQPEIIILTDLLEATHTMIDPFTNTIQIYGRFRNDDFPDGKRFHSLKHISNYGLNDPTLNESEIKSYILTAENHYKQYKEELEKANDIGEKRAISESIKRSIYSDYLDSDGSLNYFKIDNIYDDERVKNYYQSPFNLCNAYISTDHFEPINYTNMLCLPDARTLLRYSGKMNEKERRIYLIYELVAIDESDTLTLEGKTKARSQFILSLKDHKLKKEAEETIEAFDLIGLEAIKSVGYSKTKIKLLVKKAKKKRNEHNMFTKCVRDAILTRFPEFHEYYQNELFEGFNKIFESFGIEAKVNISTLEKYYGVRVLKAKGKKGIILLDRFAPEFEYD